MTDAVEIVVEEIDEVTSKPGDIDQAQANRLILIALKIVLSDSAKTTAMWPFFQIAKWALPLIGSAYIGRITLLYFKW